jgi:fatty acid desaturase
MATTLDYSHGNVPVTMLSIWLNYQTAHHLLPGVSHYHFATRTFSDAFDAWQQANGLTRHYHYEQSFVTVFARHLRWLSVLAGQPKDHCD